MALKIILYIVIGVIGGILGGMGMGGGTLLIPLLTVILGVFQKEAQAINLLSFLPMSVIAIALHYKNKLIKFDKIGFIIISGLFSCCFGFFIAKNLSGDSLKRCFGAFLIILSIVQFVGAIKSKKSK